VELESKCYIAYTDGYSTQIRLRASLIFISPEGETCEYDLRFAFPGINYEGK